jgi:hypothetical protein
VVVLLRGLVWRADAPDTSTVSTLLVLPFLVAFFWSGLVKILFTQAPHGVPAAGYAAVWAVLGLAMMVPTLDSRYLAFLFISFICLFLGRTGERAARWVFPERFGS